MLGAEQDFREAAPTGQRVAMILTLRTLYFEDLTVGMTEKLSKTISSSDVVGFAEVTGDRNPIHLSEHFAAQTPFKTRIAHGLYTASLISAVLGTRLPGPGAVYISQTLNFRAPVKIGDVVEVTVTVAELNPERYRARLTCHLRGRRRSRARRRGLGKGAVAVERRSAVAAAVKRSGVHGPRMRRFPAGQRSKDLAHQRARGVGAQLHGHPLARTVGLADEIDAERVIERRVIGVIEIDIGGIDPHPAVRSLGAA